MTKEFEALRSKSTILGQAAGISEMARMLAFLTDMKQETIAEVTGLSIDELQKIIDDTKKHSPKKADNMCRVIEEMRFESYLRGYNSGVIEGIAEGLATLFKNTIYEGMIEGRNTVAHNTAKKLYDLGELNSDIILNITGVCIDEVKDKVNQE